jgi:hypothetical protein
MPRKFFCYNSSYVNEILRSRHRADAERAVPLYVCLYRKKDGEAWRVTKAFSIGTFWPAGTQLTYRDNSIRDFSAVVISKAEYETFNFFEKEGKR